MKSLGQLLMGLLTAASSSLLVLAAASLALAEGGVNLSVRPTSSSTPASVIASPIPGQTIAATRLIPATNTPTEAAHCQTPKDWSAYTVQPGDTLESLSAQSGLSTIDILKMNCLLSNTLLPNTILYLPFTNPTATETVPPGLPTAAPTLTRIPCSPPDGWVIYVVRSGENLYRLSLAFGVEPYVLQSANCLSGATIYTGQKLFVPNVPTRAPESTQTPEPLPSMTPAPFTNTPQPAPTLAATLTPTITQIPTLTPTSLPMTTAPPTVESTTPAPEIISTIDSTPTPDNTGTSPATDIEKQPKNIIFCNCVE